MKISATHHKTKNGVIKRNPKIVERSGKFKLRYGYNSSMNLGNVIGALEHKRIPATDVAKVIKEMQDNKVPINKLANYLADYYKLLGW